MALTRSGTRIASKRRRIVATHVTKIRGLFRVLGPVGRPDKRQATPMETQPGALTNLPWMPLKSGSPKEVKNGAGNETRTRDPDLGKVVLYQLSYSRLEDFSKGRAF